MLRKILTNILTVLIFVVCMPICSVVVSRFDGTQSVIPYGTGIAESDFESMLYNSVNLMNLNHLSRTRQRDLEQTGRLDRATRETRNLQDLGISTLGMGLLLLLANLLSRKILDRLGLT